MDEYGHSNSIWLSKRLAYIDYYDRWNTLNLFIGLKNFLTIPTILTFCKDLKY